MSCGAIKAGSSKANLIKKSEKRRQKFFEQNDSSRKNAISQNFLLQRSLFLTTHLMIFFSFLPFLPYKCTKLKIHEKNTAQNIKIFEFLEEIIIKYEILFGKHNGFSRRWKKIFEISFNFRNRSTLVF
jgi:hypothetical protein